MTSATTSRWGLRVLGLGYITLLLLLPLVLIFYKTFEEGISPPLEASEHVTKTSTPAASAISGKQAPSPLQPRLCRSASLSSIALMSSQPTTLVCASFRSSTSKAPSTM